MQNDSRVNDLLADAQAIVRAEAQSISELAGRLDTRLTDAIALIKSRTGPDIPGLLVISGVGKPGIVGQRLSASFASTGTPSIFLHPVEAVHGDLGRVRRHDVVLVLSYSGESEELFRLLDVLKRLEVPIIALTARQTSTLGKAADICIELGQIEEVCPLRLAPTTTTNCISVVGDALVLGVMGLRNFSANDFALYHPAGSLGRKLMRVGQAMTFKVGQNMMALSDTLSVREALAQDRNPGRRAGAILLVSATGALSGIFTDGDLRRKLQAHADLLDRTMADVMTANPKRIGPEALASEAMALMNKYRIDELPVVDDDGRPLGLIDVQDLMSLKTVE
jgi:arabinose-5-phosphate isomerase